MPSNTWSGQLKYDMLRSAENEDGTCVHGQDSDDCSPQRKKHPPVHISLSTLHRDLILGILPFFWLQICVNSVPNRGFWEVFNMNGERD